MRTYSLLTLTIAVLLFTGCTDHLAGPSLDTQTEAIPAGESVASKSASGRLADLSLRMTVDNAMPTWSDSLLWMVEVHNEGPDRTSGVEVAISYNDSLLNVLAGATSSTAAACPSCGYNDSLGVWIVGSMPAGATERLVLVARVLGTGKITNTAEIVASDVRDPDSVPGDGDPRQDDYDSVTLVVGSGPLQ